MTAFVLTEEQQTLRQGHLLRHLYREVLTWDNKDTQGLV